MTATYSRYAECSAMYDAQQDRQSRSALAWLARMCMGLAEHIFTQTGNAEWYAAECWWKAQLDIVGF